MKKILFIAVCLPFMIYAQDKGVQFQHDLSWQQVKTKAKADNKYIFMDCFTTWCGPCRYMSTQIFPTETVGNALNAKFVNVKVQLDTTAKDDDHVKSWYQDGHDLAAQYKVRAYPTYLIFDPNGKLVHRAVGSSTAEEFIAKINNALNPETQYYTLLDKYNAGQKDSASLRKTLLAAKDAYDMDNGTMILNDYIKTQPSIYTKTVLSFIQDFTASTKDTGFKLIYKNQPKVDAVLGQGAAESFTQNFIMGEEVYSKVFADGGKTPPDWEGINKTLQRKYPAEAPEVLAKSKVVVYQYQQDWDNYKTAVVAYMDKYGAKVSPEELNGYAWNIFEQCKDMTCVTAALDWSKRSFKDNNNPNFIDTYANLLYKLGKNEDAIVWEQKAFDQASENDKPGFQKTIDKMKAGEKTWK